MMKYRGTFIVFEGIDGSGKTFLIDFCYQRLRKLGYNVLKTREPTNNQIGSFLDRYVHNRKRLSSEAEALLFAADRFEHVKTVIEPALRRGRIVISDRYLYSSLAYQGAGGLEVDWIREMNRFAPKPDLGILLDILPEFSLQRVNRRKTVFEDSDYLRKVRNIYLQMVEEEELVRIDADKPRKAVLMEVLSLVQDLLDGVKE